LAAISLLLVLAIASSFTASPRVRLSAATAYAGLIILGATLVLGPLNVLLKRPDPASSDLRRDFGIWAAALGLTHTLLAVWNPFRDVWRIFMFVPDRLLDAPGFANAAGLVGALLLLLLALLSNDWSLRTLGRVRWKSVQRLSYPLFAVVVLHTFLYDRLVQPGPFFQTLLLVTLLVVLVLQGNAWLERRAANRRRLASNRRIHPG
jgi:sulfoxide reductase heme-binding subunit YedZ